MKKQKFIYTLGILVATLLCSCKRVIQTDDLKVSKEPRFGGVYFDISIDDFNSLGFNYGDSLDVVFSNNNKVEDIPYYDGYYNRLGEYLLVAYPGYPYVDFCCNGGLSPYDTFNLDDNCTVKVKLNQKGKYLATQEALSTVYTDVRENYESDEIYANARMVTVGDIKADRLYRSASPCDNQHNRASYASKFLQDNNIENIIDLADKENELAEFAKEETLHPYWNSLYSRDKVHCYGLNMNFSSDVYLEGVKNLMLDYASNDGSFLVHCVEGKDRTGFVCIIFEALGNATVSECLDDFMITYDNYYGINKVNSKDRYEAIIEAKFLDMLITLAGEDADLSTSKEDLYNGTVSYLKRCGLTDANIQAVKDKLTSN